MKKIIGYSALFILFYSIFIVSFIPARFVLQQFDLPKNIKTYQVSGTIWHAKIKQLVVDDVVLHDVNAELDFWSIFTLSPSLDIAFGDPLKHGPEGSLTLITDGKNFTVKNADVLVAVNEIVKKAQLPLPVTAKGTLEISIEQFQSGAPMCQLLQGELRWPKAKINALKEKVTLGTLSANLGCENGALVVSIEDKNDLGLTYTAYIRSTRAISGNGYLKPEQAFPEKLKPMLSFLGKPDQQGRYRLSL